MRLIEKKNIADILMLTPVQEGILFHYLKDPHAGHYFEQLSLTITGDLNLHWVEKAWNHVINSNEMLRTLFRWEKLDRPMQIILKEYACTIMFYDLSDHTTTQTKTLLEEIKQKDRQTLFNLQEEVPWRLLVCKLSTNTHEMIISNHHILYDGWSNGILLKEFFTAYQLLATGEIPNKTTKQTFKTFLKWLQEQDHQKQAEYWQTYLKDLENTTELPLKKRNKLNNETIKHDSLTLAKECKEDLEKFIKQEHVTLASVFYTGWGILLHLYANSNDVLFGTTVSGRGAQLKGMEEMVGLFINTIPFRLPVKPETTLLQLLRTVETQLQNREKFENTPLLDIKKYSHLPGQESLFDTLLVLENYPLDKNIIPTGCALDVHSYTLWEMTHYALTVSIMPFDEFKITFSYLPGLVARETVAGIAQRFSHLLKIMVTCRNEALSTVELLTEEERNTILYTFNAPENERPQTKTIQQFFTEQVQRTPDGVAVVGGFDNEKSIPATYLGLAEHTEEQGFQLSYQHVHHLSDKVALHLLKKGILRDNIVGIMGERSLLMVIGILGILKAGGAYLPIDNHYPEERKQFILADSGTKIVLTETSVKQILEDPQQESQTKNYIVNTMGNNLAYVIYTSGSTGKPKGVLVEHGSAVNILQALQERYPVDAGATYLFKTAYVFDVSVTELFGWFMGGGRLAVLEKNGEKDPHVIYDWIHTYQVTHINFVPSMFYAFSAWLDQTTVAALASLQYIFLAGEALLAEQVQKFADFIHTYYPGIGIENIYGPTESTVYASWFSLSEWSAGEPIAIGKPVPNLTLYIVDAFGRLLPPGIAGELWIAGHGVARGYLNNPELTAQKFLTTALNRDSAVCERFYRTGDLCLWGVDGNILYLGRMDHQVKIRGFRIELGEIENVLLKHEQITAAAVLVHTDNTGDKTLVAYIVGAKGVPNEKLSGYLSGYLPDYMVPTYYVHLDKIPLTATGKLDRRALPAPTLDITDTYVAPRNELEKQMAILWGEVLGKEALTIGIDNHFFQLGGHSLKATSLVARIHKAFQVKIPLNEFFKRPTIRQVVEYILASREEAFLGLETVTEKEYYALSSVQKRLYFLQQLDVSGTTYHLMGAWTLEGTLDHKRLEKIFMVLIKRHEALRTIFTEEDETPVQRVLSEVSFTLERCEVTGLMDFIRPFDLGQAPLMRVGLAQLAPEKYLLIVDMHHIIADGWSLKILVEEFTALWKEESLRPLIYHYKEYAEHQQKQLNSGVLLTQKNYWLESFADEMPVLNLPTDYKRPAVQSFAGDTLTFTINNDSTQEFLKLIEHTDSTLFNGGLVLYSVFLAKITGQEDVVIGTPVAGRRHADLEKMMGMFVNTLPLRNYPAGKKTFLAYWQEVTERTLKSLENQEYQYEDMVVEFSGGSDASRNPLFDTLFLIEDESLRHIDLPGLTLTPYALPQKTAKFDLSLFLRLEEDHVVFTFEYNTDLFKRETITRFSGYMRTVLAGVLVNPEQSLADIEIISAEEKYCILVEFNQTATEYPADKTIPQLFVEQVQRTPDGVAVVGVNDNGKSIPATCLGLAEHTEEQDCLLSYQQIHYLSDIVAQDLLTRGLLPEEIVGLYGGRSVLTMIGLLGILKAGGAYMPIDENYPEERKHFMLADSNTKIILTESSIGKTLLETPQINWVSGSFSSGKGNHLVYVIYTSGSTGTPKGVMVTHQNVVRLVKNTNYVDFNAGARILQTGAMEFDASTFEIWGALLNGLTLVLVAKDTLLFADSLKHIIRFYHIQMMWMTSPWFNQMMQLDSEIFAPLSTLLVGGDVLSPTNINRLRHLYPHIKVINGYGPTENTTFSTSFWIQQDYLDNIPIGKPIANSTTFIIDGNNHLLPVGIPGELVVGGDGVARGYMNNPTLSAEKFIHLPHLTPVFTASPLFYKTGDLARWLSGGEIEFLGRLDFQVKVRGFRVELGEIENRLLTFPGIQEGLVLVHTDKRSDKVEILAYYVAATAISKEALRQHLVKHLPQYMIPAFFIQVPHMPLTSSGKINRAALPLPVPEIGDHYEEPQNELEQQLQQIWQEVLADESTEKPVIGVLDNFFHRGGHSLTTTSLVAKIYKLLKVKVPLLEVFQRPTIRSLADYIRHANTLQYIDITPIEKKEYYCLSSAQKRMYFLQQLEKEGTTYNIYNLWLLYGIVDQHLLAQTFLTLIRRHESFRTSFVMVAEEPVQIIHPEVNLAFEYEESKRSEKEIMESFIRPFDLSQAPLLRFGLVKLAEAKFLLQMDMHHIISDGMSMEVLRREFAALLAGATLAPLRIQYKDYAVWQNKERAHGFLRGQGLYWEKVFAGEIPVLDLPLDYHRPAVQSFAGDSCTFQLEESVVQGLHEISLTSGATLYMVLLSLYSVLLARLSGQTDMVIGTPVAARRHTEMEGIIGMFVNTLALRLYPQMHKTFLQFLLEVKTNTLEAFENQEYPYEELVDQVMVNRDMSRNPLFDTLFVLQSVRADQVVLQGLEIIPCPIENNTAKFDLSLTAIEVQGKMSLQFEYAIKLFKRETIERFIRCFTTLVDSVLAAPGLEVGEIALLTPQERHHLLLEINAPTCIYATERTLPGLFAQQVEKNPEAPALIGLQRENRQGLLTYRQLDQLARTVAAQLLAQGVGRNAFVGLLVERGMEMIAAILGILQAGAAYVPLDPKAPTERLQYLLHDCGAKYVVTFSHLTASWQPGVPMLYLDTLTTDNRTTEPLQVEYEAQDLAYIIYTSGSTGKPKGVPISHANLMPLLFWGYQHLRLEPGDRVLQNLSYFFDWSVWEIFITLGSGASLFIVGEEMVLEPAAMVAFMQEKAITVLHITPTQYGYLVNTGLPMLSLAHLCIGAEKLTYDLVARGLPLLSADCRIYNMYGPTEATIISAVLEVDRGAVDFYEQLPSVPIGQTVANTTLLVLDGYMNPCPLNVVGELYIAGDALARGYWNDPQKTAQSFIPNPFKELKSRTLYKTGDRVRRLENGHILFISRADDQVKIRGYRIELGEIENRILRYRGIKEALVLVREDEQQEKWLCAYLVCPQDLDTAALREFLNTQLPAYMVPTYLIKLEQLPLNANGKVDKKRLPLPEKHSKQESVTPQTDVEKTIAAIWQEVLNLEYVGSTDNFFELGGNSMNIMKVVQHLKTHFQKDIPLMTVFRYPTIKALASYFESTPSQSEVRIAEKPVKPVHKPMTNGNLEIAVIGMAGRFPGARNVTELWQNIQNGVESIVFFSAQELLENGNAAHVVDDPQYIKTSASIRENEYFDSAFFGYTPLEAEIIDPQLRVFHECVWEALEDAAYVSDSYPGRIGLYVGGESSSLWEVLTSLSPLAQHINPLILNNMNNKDYLGTRISYKFNFTGPSLSLNTACSTSLVAIHLALQGLQLKECELALAGGVRVALPGKSGYLYQEGMIQSPDGHCRAFDARANGTVSNDGAAVVVLKPLGQALRDGDHIYAVVKGSAINNDGSGKVGFHAPSIAGQAAVIHAAQTLAGCSPESIAYVETHGTGTQLGDAVEMEALIQTFTGSQKSKNTDKKYCALGSVKTNFGHLGSAAGVTGFIKVALSLQHQLIPPSLHFENPNPKIDFANSPFYVNTSLQPWPNTMLPARAGVSSFGIGGTNAHVVLEAPPAQTSTTQQIEPGAAYVLLLSAKTPSALHNVTVNLADYLKANPDISLADVAFTLQVGRKRLAVRRSVLCTDVNQAVEALVGSEPGRAGVYLARDNEETRHVVFMFPGLGPQYVNMGVGLYHQAPKFRQEIDFCLDILKDILPIDIKGILYPAGEPTPHAINSMFALEVAQPVLFMFEYALAKLLMSWGIRPVAMIGYSFGEYVAACLAGVFSVADVLQLLVVRGRLIATLPPGAMLSVPLPVAEVGDMLPPELSIAIDNGASTVVSGPSTVIADFARFIKEKKILCAPFESPYAAHSAALDAILDSFQQEVAKISLHAPSIPYISTVTGTWIKSEEACSPAYWAKQFRSTVHFVRGIHEIVAGQYPLFLEVGPGRDMSALVNREITDKATFQTVSVIRHRGTQPELSDEYYLLDKIGRLWLYGVQINWTAYYAGRKRNRLALPTYPFERKRYWKIIDDYQAGYYSFLQGAPSAQDNRTAASDMALQPAETTSPNLDLPGVAWQTRPQLSTSYVAPETDLQKSVVSIWKRFFGYAEIGVTDDFFELGGDSLKATSLLSSLHKEVNLHVPLKYFFDHPTIEKIASYQPSGTPEEGVFEKTFKAIEPLEKKEYYPLSSAQKRMYFFQQLDVDSIAYNNVLVNILKGDLDLEKLNTCFKTLLARHEILRTAFMELAGELVQRVADEVVWSMQQLLTPVVPPDRELTGLLKSFVRPFQLAHAPLLRVGLWWWREKEYLLIVDMHHIISDGVSLALFIEEFLALYQGHNLAAPHLQYKDYAVWQKKAMDSGTLSAQREYWLTTYADEIPVLDLPYDYSRPQMRTFAGKSMTFEIPAEVSHAFLQLLAHAGVTLYMGLLAVTTLFLSKISGQDTIIIGTPITGRTHSDMERIMGMFVNTLAMKNQPLATLTGRDFLNAVKENVLNAFANQDFQYEELVELLVTDRSSGRNPLFDTVLALQNITMPTINIPGLTVTPYPYQTEMIKFDLTFQCFEKPDALFFTLEYSTELFQETTIKRFIVFYKQVFSEFVAEPGAAIATMEIITADEKAQILRHFNDTTRPFPADKTLVQLFREQVERTPDRVAIKGKTLGWGSSDGVGNSSGEAITWDGCVSYAWLNEQAQHLAAVLASLGVVPNTLMAIMAEPSIEFIIGLLGILNAGGAYLPIGPDYPQERIAFILHDSMALKVLTRQEISRLITLPAEKKKQAVVPEVQATDLAYIIYTSGSTGRPKGVLIEHRQIVNTLLWRIQQYAFQVGEPVLQLFSFAFDGSVTSFFTPVVSGAPVVLLTQDELKNVGRIQEVIVTEGIVHFFCVPSLYRVLLEISTAAELARVRFITLGGEAIPPDLVVKSKALYPGLSIHNEYGPTESSVQATFCPDVPAARTISIGKPIANTVVFIMDAQFHLLPIGIPGQLIIAGKGLARGYLNKPELTAEKFISPSAASFGLSPLTLRWYQTGDLARWLPDGQIQFLGRLDDQVKIRGYRIELGEIENCLLKIPAIKEAVVMAREDGDGQKYLCAYFVADTPHAPIFQWRENLAQELPDYMVPAYFVPMEKIPLTATGKINRRAFPLPELPAGEQYTAPTNDIEKRLQRIWLQALYGESLSATPSDTIQKKVGIHHNFFHLGGHSLTATLVASRIHKEFNIKVPLPELFKRPTIKGLAEYLKQALKEHYSEIERVEEQEYYVLSSAQKRLFFLQQLDETGIAYHIGEVWLLTGELEQNKLQQAIKKLIQRHESIRTSFAVINQEPVQRIWSEVDFAIEYYENEQVPGFIRPFDLAQAPLLRVGLAPLEPGKHLLMVDMHHIISDGNSMAILAREFTSFFAGMDVAPLHVSYKDYACWQNREKTSARLQQQELFWKNQFADDIPVLELPLDFVRPALQSFAGHTLHMKLEPALTTSLKTVALESGATLYMVLLSLYTIFLAKISGADDVVVGTPIAGRRHADLENIIGMFVNTLALRHFPSGEKTFPDYLEEVKTRTLNAFENEELQYEDLVDRVGVKRDISRNPLFDTMLVLQNIGLQALEIPGLTLQPYPQESQTAKFDLTVTLVEIEDYLALSFEYGKKLFKAETIQRWMGYFIQVITQVCAARQVSIAAVDLLSVAEKAQILAEFNQVGVAFPQQQTIAGLFLEQCLRTPDGIALQGNDKNGSECLLSYQHLDQLAQRVANLLRKNGVGPDTIVGIHMERSLNMIIGLMGIVLSGGAYLPLDPDYPEERKQFMLADSGATILVHEALIDQALNNANTVSATTTENIQHHVLPHHLAYVIYTSGTTGKPKGVLVTQENVVQLFFNDRFPFLLGSRDVWTMFHSYCFDFSVWEMYGALLRGGRLVVIPRVTAMETQDYLKVLQKQAVTILNQTPSSFYRLIEEEFQQPAPLLALRYIIFGGEALQPAKMREWQQRYPQTHLINMYGITETTVHVTFKEITEQDIEAAVSNIGKPLPTLQVIILDSYKKLVPIGLTGEMYVCGAGVARGYLNRALLTEERFVVLPESAYGASTRWYKTGDLARWLTNGDLQYIGRADHQVKIRGFRIELGEIESRLAGFTGILQNVVIVRERKSGEKFLCAYFTATETITLALLREYLAHHLPDYMIPAYLMQLEKIPTTANGKVDKKHLPVPEIKVDQHFVAPQSDQEKTIATIWRDVLELEHVGIHDNFFELGGSSMDIVKVGHRLKEELGVDVPLVVMLRFPTIKAITTHLAQQDTVASAPAHLEMYQAIDKGKNLLKKRMEKRKMKDR